MLLCMEKRRNLIWILWVVSFDWAFNGCGGVFIDLQVNTKTWSFSIHCVPSASLFSFRELRNYFFNRIFGRNWHHSFPTLKIVEINLFRWNFLLCSVVLVGHLQFALWSALCQLWAHSCCAGGLQELRRGPERLQGIRGAPVALCFPFRTFSLCLSPGTSSAAWWNFVQLMKPPRFLWCFVITCCFFLLIPQMFAETHFDR